MITYLLFGLLFLAVAMDFSLKDFIDRCNDVTLPVAIPLTIIMILLWPLVLIVGGYLGIKDFIEKRK